MTRIGYLLLAASVSGCAYLAKAERQPPAPPAPPLLIEGREDEFRETCAARYRAVLERDIDPSGAEVCLDLARRGYTAEQIDEWLKSSPEYAALLERKDREAREAEERKKREEEERERNRARLRGRLRADGTRIVDADGKSFTPIFASALTILVRPADVRAAFLDDLRDGGFNGFRVFAGRLTWADQTPASALVALPVVLQEAADRGLYVQVTAITDSRDGGYDERAHLSAVADVTATFENVLLEAGNELYHGTQSDLVNDTGRFCALAREVLAGYPNLWALGAGSEDEPINGRYSAACGTFNTVHLRRGRPADMLAALAGLEAIALETGRPVLNSEPIGAAEASVPGRRLANPDFFAEMAHQAVSRGVGSVFHSEDGLFVRPLGPVQRAAAKAFVEGSRRAPVSLPAPPAPDASCASAQSPLAVVVCERERYPAGHLTPLQLADLMRAIARTLNANEIPGGPWGVLQKLAGNNCDGLSCDIICAGNGPAQRQFDALVASETLAQPDWSPVDPAHQAVRVCEVVPAGRLESGPPWPEGSLGALPLPAVVSMKGGRK